ncbi:MAG: signal peptidase I [Bacteroidales bacterium]|nr:signal peptidase I [Bacteroidales bacterium]
MHKKFLKSILFTIIILFFILGTFRTYMVSGNSDVPTFVSGDKLIINRSAFDLTLPFSNLKVFKLGKPERGDMVLCQVREKDQKYYWLKRIIGLPGDTIELKQNKIYINRIPLKYEFLSKENFNLVKENSNGEFFARETGLGLQHNISFSNKNGLLANYGPIIVKENHYFVLGDNRDNSMDSRLFGMVHRNRIYGKYIIVLSRINS